MMRVKFKKTGEEKVLDEAEAETLWARGEVKLLGKTAEGAASPASPRSPEKSESESSSNPTDLLLRWIAWNEKEQARVVWLGYTHTKEAMESRLKEYKSPEYITARLWATHILGSGEVTEQKSSNPADGNPGNPGTTTTELRTMLEAALADEKGAVEMYGKIVAELRKSGWETFAKDLEEIAVDEDRHKDKLIFVYHTLYPLYAVPDPPASAR